MSDQGSQSDNKNAKWCDQLSFVKVFQGFRSAIQPGKLLLAAMGIIAIFLWGWMLDALWNNDDVMIFQPQETVSWSMISGLTDEDLALKQKTMWTDLDLYISSEKYHDKDTFEEKKQQLREDLLDKLEIMVQMPPFEKDREAVEQIIQNDKFSELKDTYMDQYNAAWKILNERYIEAVELRKDEKESITQAYRDLHQHLTCVNPFGSASVNKYINILIQPNSNLTDAVKIKDDKERVQKNKAVVENAVTAANVNNLVQALEGRGIFDTFVGFKLRHLHGALLSMVTLNCNEFRMHIWNYLLGLCWLTRFHTIFTALLILGGLAVWALFGGAVSRMTAINFAREERIGPFNALKFSAGKFVHLFSAPLLPIFIIILLAIMIWVPSWLVAIPRLGEIIGAFIFPLAMVAGFLIALIAIGLIGGFNFMTPTIVVEGSDGFDAISRSFSYVFARPWHFIFYSAIGFIYGGLCYLFVRVFAILMLYSVRIACGTAINFDKTSEFITQGKLNAMFPAPSWEALHGGGSSINWTALNATECFGAFFIMIWIGLVVAAVLGFLCSFYFSVNTIIYFLLRKHVDSTDYEDVFVEEDMDSLLVEELSEEEKPASEQAPQHQGDQAPPPSDSKESESIPLEQSSDDSPEEKSSEQPAQEESRSEDAEQNDHGQPGPEEKEDENKREE